MNDTTRNAMFLLGAAPMQMGELAERTTGDGDAEDVGDEGVINYQMFGDACIAVYEAHLVCLSSLTCVVFVMSQDDSCV